MLTLQQSDPSNPSGDGPTDGNTYVNDAAFGSTTQDMGGLIAHEEKHQDGWENRQHGTGVADVLQFSCSSLAP